MPGTRSGRSAFILVLALTLASLSHGQTQAVSRPVKPAQAPRPAQRIYTSLAKGESTPLPISGPVSLFAGSVCDAKGHLFAMFGPGLSALASNNGGNPANLYETTAIRRVSAADSSVISYSTQPPPGYVVRQRVWFNADPDGRLYELIRASKDRPTPESPALPDSLIVRYNDDGSVDSAVSLDKIPGRPFRPLSFAPFANPMFLVAGLGSGSKSEPFPPIAAVFDSFGKYIAEVRQDDEELGKGDVPGAARFRGKAAQPDPFARMAGAPDGNVYVLMQLSEPHVYAISPAGMIVKDFPIAARANGLDPDDLSYAEAMTVVGTASLAILFDRAPSVASPAPHSTLVLLDLISGDVSAAIDVSSGVPSSAFPVCAVAPDTWYFLNLDSDAHPALVKYHLR